MKHILFVAAASLTTIASPAFAVATFSQDITSSIVYGASGSSANFGHAPNGAGETLVNGKFDFEDTFTFNYDFDGITSGSVINVLLGAGAGLQDIDFASITLNGMTGSVANIDGLSTAVFENVAFTAGLQTVVISGSSTGTASYGGNIQIIPAAVPEPATWAMLVLGFGLAGAGMRKRRVRTVTA